MLSRKGFWIFLCGFLLCFLLTGGGLAEDADVMVAGDIVDRGVYHDDYPAIEDFAIEENGTELGVGDTVHFRLKPSSSTNVQYVNLYFGRNEDEEQYVQIALNEDTGYFEGTYTFKKTDKTGLYYVTSCYVADDFDYSSSYGTTSKRVMQRLLPGYVYFNNADGVSEGPITGIVLEENGRELAPGDTLHISFDLPAQLEISSIYATFYRKNGGTSISLHYYSWDDSENDFTFDSETGHVTGEYTLTDTLVDGGYYLGSISAHDSDGGSYEADRFDTSAYTFTLRGAVPAGNQAVKFSDFVCEEDGQTLVDGDTLHFTFKLDTEAEIRSATVEMAVFNGNQSTYGSGIYNSKSYRLEAEAAPDEAGGLYRAEYTLKEDDLYGVYSVGVSVSYGESHSYSHFDSDVMFLFAEKKEESFKRLAPAKDLHWTEDGYVCFTLPEDHQGRVDISIYNELGESFARRTYSRIENASTEFQTDMYLSDEDIMTGRYYFTVTTSGDGKEYFDSETVKSGLLSYQAPARQLGTVTEMVWIEGEDGIKRPRLTMPKEKTYLRGYECHYYYSETLSDPVVDCHMYGTPVFHDGEDKIYGYGRIYDDILQTYGAGYYYVRVRLLSDNILECRNGEESELSPGCYFGAEANTVAEKLNEVVTVGKTAEEIREQVQQIDTEELKTAMLTQESVPDTLRRLEASAKSATVVEVTADAPEIAGRVTTVGAGLNEVTGEAPKLIIDKPKQNDVLPAAYNAALAVRFSMELENVENPDDLKVPVLIDIPIPEEIHPAFLVVLHYHLSDREPEVISPYVYQAGNRWYAQFVLTSFSDFALTQPTPNEEDMTILALPADLAEIGDRAFRSITANIVIIPDGCVRIGSEAFSNCEGLYKILIPKSVTSIADDAFSGTSGFCIVTDNEAVITNPAFSGIPMQAP